MDIRLRLILMNFLQFGLWGAYLISMGSYLVNVGLGGHIGIFYGMQGIVSLFMPALVGIIADRWVQAQKMYSVCHLISGLAMLGMALYGKGAGHSVDLNILLLLYGVSIAFYMPSLSLSYSVAYNALEKAGKDTVSTFPFIRFFGTVGFICAMLAVDYLGYQASYMQFLVSAILSLILSAYGLTLPVVPTTGKPKNSSIVDALGLRAFVLFKDRQMAIFFLFCILLGVALQITNGYANPFITSFKAIPEYADSFGANHANALISISQCAETLCILLIPFFLKRFGIKKVMLISMLAWVLRFGLFGLGNPGSGVWMFILSMLVYGVAFDFFNVSGSLFVNQSADVAMRSSAQGLFVLMSNGIGSTIGTLAAQIVVNRFTHAEVIGESTYTVGQWEYAWFIFASYALVIAVLFYFVFPYRHVRQDQPIKA